MRLTWDQCADILMTSRTTLWRRCQKLGVGLRTTSNISDSDLDAVMQRLVHQHPRCGTIMGYLRSYGIHTSRRRVRECLLRVSPRMVELRATTTVARRQYTVASSNAFWHIDGLHCLVRWRMRLMDIHAELFTCMPLTTTELRPWSVMLHKSLGGHLEFDRITVEKTLMLLEQ